MKGIVLAIALGGSLAACSTNGIQSRPEPLAQNAALQGHDGQPSSKWERSDFDIGPSTRFHLAHSCPAGYTFVISGGYRVTDGQPEILGSYPNASSTAWFVSGYTHDHVHDVKLTIIQLCGQKAP